MDTISISVPSNPNKDTISLSRELLDIIPNSFMVERDDSSEIKIKILEDVGPQWIVLKNSKVQLVLKIVGYKSREYLRTKYPISNDHPPQLVVSNFSTDVGMRVVELLMKMFPFDGKSRQVANFAVQGDFMYFRLYKYCFGEKGPIMEDIGPHLTLRLWRMIEYDDGKKKVRDFRKFVKNSGIL